MSEFAKLELSLWRSPKDNTLALGALYTLPGEEDREPDSAHSEVSLDLAGLEKAWQAGGDAAYGQALTGMIFQDEKIKQYYRDARKAAARMRLRLRFEFGDNSLHALRWETLCDPETHQFLAPDEHVLLSRILLPESSSEKLPAAPPRSQLKALVVIADPTDATESYGMDGNRLVRVNVTGVRTAVGALLKNVQVTWLCAGGDDKPTEKKLIERMRDGCDALYLVCHGALEDNGPGKPPAAKIWLENEAGLMDTVYVGDQVERDGRITPGLATRIKNLTRKPRLAVLSSCQSGGRSHDRGALAGFGPRLVAAGVPAVVAMQDDVEMKTADAFVETFFQVLLHPAHGGEIDAAVAAARGHVSGQADWAAAVLFMSLASGRLFDEAGARELFMVDPLKDVIPRTDLRDQVVAALFDGATPRVTTVSLHGSGGFGKTTLARAVCHERKVWDAFDGGILWTELGQTPNVRRKLAGLCAALSGERQNFGSVSDASRELARLLDSRRCLLVVDDVWNEADLRPFLEGGAACSRLITTRDTTIALGSPSAPFVPIKVGEMTEDEAYHMLTDWLAPSQVVPIDPKPFSDLAKRAGYLPLLLGLIAGGLRERMARGASLGAALAYVNKALDKAHVVAFDVQNAKERDQAVDRSIGASLRLLSKEEKKQFLQLAIFPKDADVPLAAVGQLWDMPPFETERQCERFDRLSLLRFDLRTNAIRLHGVMRDYLAMHLADPAQWHLRLLDTWGDPHSLPTEYAWRWYAYHLAEASMAKRSLDLARRLVETVLDDQFQTGHLTARHDPAALVADAALAVDTLAGSVEPLSWPLEPAATPLVVVAARGHVTTRMERLAPEHLFGKAAAGDVAGAETYLGLFTAEREWRQACQLLIAWLAAPRNPAEARALFGRVSADLPGWGPLMDMADCVGSILNSQPWPQASLPDPSRDTVDKIIAYMTGLNGASSLPYERNPYRGGPPTESGYHATERMEPADSHQLVGYAARHPREPQDFLDDHLAILAANSYRRYRNRFLWPLMESVICHPDPEWARGWAVKVAITALSPSRLEFQEGAGIMALALRVKAQPGQWPHLDGYGNAVVSIAKTLEHNPRGDVWGSYTRRLSCLALAYRLLDDPSRSHKMIEQAQHVHFGYAGLQSPAWLALAETMLICGEPAGEIAAVRESARVSAVNVQELVFCAQTTARWQAIDGWWKEALDLPRLVDAIDDLHRGRHPERFAGLHLIGEEYLGRIAETEDTEQLERMLNARSLADIEAVHDQSLADLVRLNPGLPPYDKLDETTPVLIPDPNLAAQIAAHLAARALALPGADPVHRVQLVQALAPVALANPTALDTVLTLLLYAAGCAWEPVMADDAAGIFGDVTGFLHQRVEADLPAGAPPPTRSGRRDDCPSQGTA